jgi:hypothetical protein
VKPTILDHFTQTCGYNPALPVCRAMGEVIKQTQPIPHQWSGWPAQAKPEHLPGTPIVWPDSAFAVGSPNGPIIPGTHGWCFDIGQGGYGIDPWIDTHWYLQGAIVFQYNERVFDVIPLLLEAEREQLCLPEMQLHYVLSDDGWTWSKAVTGPVNALFHDAFLDYMREQDREQVYEAINILGNHVSSYLGAYWSWLHRAPGRWLIRPAKEPRVKTKNGKVKKIYDEGTLGYKEYEPMEEEPMEEADASVARSDAQ